MSSPPRAWRAACPGCGAPVEFASAASASAVCGFCRSTLLRDGEALRRIGVSAELFDDHSPLQLGASGRHQGEAFTLVGRLQVAVAPDAASGSAGGERAPTWNEWHALFHNGRSGWLSEDNGAYVFAFDAPPPADAPRDLAPLRAGQRVLLDGRAWDIASVQRARLLAAEGELPAPPPLQRLFHVVDVRNAAGEVGTLDDGPGDGRPLQWAIGRGVELAALALQGQRERVDQDLRARQVECPSCGAPLAPTLAGTQSIVCGQCAAVVDLSGGVGAELQHYAQANAGAHGAEPLIPLGRSGTLALGGAPRSWQVVGYQERCDIPQDADDETSYWREYLLYGGEAGFAFLVDAEDGWSWMRPITGVPVQRGERAEWDGAAYQLKWRYGARVTWVQGEFYWPLRKGEQAQVSDYEGTGAHRDRRLSREATLGGSGSEVVWSAGRTLAADAIAQAFALQDRPAAALHRGDVKPFAGKGVGLGTLLAVFVGLLLLALLLTRCDRDECDQQRATFGAASNEYRQCLDRRGSGGGLRTRGGSFGGAGGGGGHK